MVADKNSTTIRINRKVKETLAGNRLLLPKHETYDQELIRLVLRDNLLSQIETLVRIGKHKSAIELIQKGKKEIEK